ncbi:MAG: hypothetical protein HY937_09330 [Nitrosomonadales bacterium]|nr:hypothetical protein [Nitrosomonadales bacterium]
MAILIATRGPKFGECNICGDNTKLTEDHTPPKGCIKIGQVELHHITEHLAIERTKSKGYLSQNGVKYRTLCARCNNGFLGARYDQSLIDFVNGIGNSLRSEWPLPHVLSIRTKPQKLMRSLLGHLSAQGVGRYQKGSLTEPIRDYFLDETKPLPDGLKIYFWLYPFKHHVMARDCGYVDLRIQEPVVVWFLKFFPVAFMVTFEEPASYSFPFVCLSSWGKEQIDFEAELPVDLRSITPEYWPEAPTRNSVVMYGQEAIVSFNWKKLQVK